MKFQRLVVFAAALTVLAGLPAVAEGQGEGAFFNVKTPRAMGMGNTAVGIGGDYTALFYNPASLTNHPTGAAFIDAMEFQVLGPVWEINGETIDFISEIADAGNTAEAIAILQGNKGKPIFTRAGSISYVTAKISRVAFGVAPVINWTFEQSIQDRELLPNGADTLVTRKTTDVGGIAGVSFDVIEKWLAVGANLKLFNRWRTQLVQKPLQDGGFEFDPEVVEPFGGCGSSTGNCRIDGGSEFAAGVDLGGMFILPLGEIPVAGNVPGIKDSRFQVGVVWQDVGDTRLDQGDIKQTVDVGIAYSQDVVIGDLIVGADFRDLNLDGIDFEDKINLGTELAFNEILSLRMGMNQVGFTAGGSLRLWAVRIEGGFFQAKMQPPVEASERDNRFFISMGLGWYN